MAINILQELNLGAAKASFSRDEVETLADIKKLDVAQKYPNNYDIFCKEDGCKYRLNKTSHSTMQDNLPHPTGKWRRVDSVISSSMPAPITVGDVVLYLGPTVMDQVDHSKVKFQTGKYYRTEYTKVNKQMYAFVQNTAPDVPDTSPNPAVIWFSETSTLSEGSVLFTPVNGSIFDNKEHGIIMTSDWDGQSAISGSSYEYLDNSNNAKLGMVRNSNFDITFDSFPELTWNMFDTEAELENIKQNVIPEAISSATEEIKTEVKEEVKEDVDANLGQAKKLNDILTDGDIKLLKQGGIEKLVSSKPDATVSDSTIGFVQCDCNRNEETGEVTLNITDVKYGPFTQEEITENAFVDENEIIVPSDTGMPIYAITCSVTNKAKDAIFCALKDSNLYKGTLGFDAINFISRLQEGLPIVVGFAAAAPYKDEEHSGSVDSNTYVSLYNLLEIMNSGGNPAFTPVPVSEIPDIKNRAVELLEKETALDLILFVICAEGGEFQLASSNILETFNEQFVIGTEASGILNEFPTMKKEIEDSITEEFRNVKKLNDSLNEEDVETIISRPRESLFDVKSPYIPYGNKLLTECTFVKLEADENGIVTIADSATVSDALSLPGDPLEWLHDGQFAVLFGIMQSDSYVGYQRTAADIYNCSFKVDYESPDIDISRKPENMFGIDSVYFAVGNNGDEWGEIEADFTACKFTDIDTYAPGTEDVDGRHLFGDLIGDYEENGTPITLRNYSKSNYTVLYGIALFDASGNVISESDYTSKNITASINKRVVPAYQESGLLVDFPKIEEQIAAVKTMADEFDTVKQNANKAIELALPAETKDYIDENIFEKIAINLVNASYNFRDANKYTHIVGLNGDTAGGTYDPQSSSRTITPKFWNYFDASGASYTSNTSEMLMSNPSAYSSAKYIGILGSINCGRKDDLLNNLKGMAVNFDPGKYLIKNNNTYFSIVDIYINTNIVTSNYADYITASSWTRLNSGDSIYDIFSNKSIPTYYGDGNIQFIFVISGYYGDSSFSDIAPFEANVGEIVALASVVKSPFDVMKKKIDSIEANALNEASSSYFKNNVFDSNTTFSELKPSYYQYTTTDYTGFVSLGTTSYDHTAKNRSIAPVFKNYFDNSKDDYVSSEEVLTANSSTNDRYAGFLCSVAYGTNRFEEFVKSLQGMAMIFDSNKSIAINGVNYKIVDTYVRIYQDTRSYETNYANQISNSGWTRVDSVTDLSEVVKNATYNPTYKYCWLNTIVVIDAFGNDTPVADLTPFSTNKTDILSQLFSLAKIPIETKISTVNRKIDSLGAGRGIEYFNQNIFSTKDFDLANTAAYNNTNFTHLVALGTLGEYTLTYDHTDPERAVAPKFYNYFDSSTSSVTTDIFSHREGYSYYDSYIGLLGVLDYSDNTENPGVFETRFKNLIAKFDPNKKYYHPLTDGYNTQEFRIVDVYINIAQSDLAENVPSEGWYRIESGEDIGEAFKNVTDISGTRYAEILIVLDAMNWRAYSGSYDRITDASYIYQYQIDGVLANIFDLAFSKLETRLNEIESSVTDSVDNISDSMSDYMSAKWLPTPIAFPDEALENEQEPSGNSKNYDFLLYPTFVDVPHSTGSSVEGKKSSYSVKPIPESGENTTVKALYESEDSMYLLFGFFGEKLLPESLGGDYTIPETYNENTIESFNRVSKTLWYSDIYLNMQNTFSYSMIKGIRDSLLEIDVSNIFLNFNPRVIKSLYAKVTADPGNELTYSTYTSRGLNNMEDFVKIPYANIQDINTISMEDIVNMCGRPDKTKSSGSSKAVVLFIAEIDKSSFPGLASLTTLAYGVSNTTSDILAIYQAMFANNSESSPIYMARSINDSLKKTKEVAVEAARYAAATLTAAKHYDTLSDLKLLISEGESGYIVRNGETEGTSVADVYIKTTEGALIKIASGVEYEAPIS